MQERTEQIPKRGRWTKRICVVLVVYMAATIAGRLWWGRYADSQLQAELDAIRARGEIIEWSDLASKPIPDDENAAELYKKAFESPLLRDYYDENDDSFLRISNMPPHLKRLESMISYLSYPDFRREHKKEFREILKLSADALALCRQARGLKKVDWKIDFTGPALETLLPALSTHKNCARLLCLAALEAHDAGDDAKAVEYIRDAIALADAIENMPVLVCHLVAVAVNSLACDTIERITPSLRIGDDGRSASAKQVRLLIDQLLDERALQKGLYLAFTGERAMLYDTAERLRRGEIGELSQVSLGSGKFMFVFTTGPMWMLSEVRMLRYMSGYVLAAGEQNVPAAVAKLPPTPEHEFGSIKAITRLLDSILLPAFGRTFTLHFSGVSQRRLAAVALAIRLYELDHGHRPTKLDELVGKYLASIPADPFTKDDLPMLYASEAEKPILYSVGANGKDDGGQYEMRESGGVDWDKADIPFFLNGDRPVGECDWEEPETQPARRGRRIRPMSATRASEATSKPTRVNRE